jgi:hypothetical protein
MLVNGRDCSVIIKTACVPSGRAREEGIVWADSHPPALYRETGIPYAEETIRETVSLLTEEASIEGDGSCRAIRKSGQQVGLGVTGCVVTPLTSGRLPCCFTLLWGVAACPCMCPKPGTFTFIN